MKHVYKAFYGALLVLGLAGIHSQPAQAQGSRYDSVCNCMRPESEYNTRRVVRAPAQVRTHQRVVDHTNVVRRTHLIQENRLVVHVRPVIDREVVVHRQNTVIRNITLHKVNTTNKQQNEYRREVVNRSIPGSTRVVNERREVRGVNCNCGPYDNRGGGYRTSQGDEGAVSYRD
jgi:hypothetical protein